MKICEREDCGVEFKPKYPSAMYCTRSCAAKVNNSKHPKRQARSFCSRCGCKVNNAATKECMDCYRITQSEKKMARIQEWLDGEWSGGSEYTLSDLVRSYLLEQANYACVKCGFNTPHPDDGASILEVDHINGNGSDHRPENLIVLCPNCHALTSTYRNRNAGNGRDWIYVRRPRPRQDSNLHASVTLSSG